jgi:CDP-paratose 2-epimerase
MGKIDQGILAFWVARHFFQRPLKYIGFGGSGKQVRDFLHVNDMVELVLEQIERFEAFEGETFNVGGGPAHSVSLLELTDLCQQATDKRVTIEPELSPRTADVRIYQSDCSKLFRRTSWRPRASARETIADIATWIRENAGLLAGTMG